MKSFSDFNKEAELYEGSVRSLLSATKSIISRTFSKAMKGLKRLKSGQTLNVRFSLPKMTNEEKQTGKKGGELAEVALLKDLYRQLSLLNVDVQYGQGEPPRPMSLSAFNEHYKKNLKEYRAQEAGNKVKREKDWISHGKAGADHIMTYLHGLPGDWGLYEVTLVHLGEELTGKSKGDINIQFRAKDTDKILKDIGHLSLKATLKGTPYNTPDNGLQTSWNSFVFQLLTGKTSRQLEFVTSTSVEKTLERANKRVATANDKLTKALEKESVARTPKQTERAKEAVEKHRLAIQVAQKQVEDAQEEYKNTLEYNLDELGKSLGYKTLMAKYMVALTDRFTAYNKAPGDARKGTKDADLVLDNRKATKEYMTVIRKALEAYLKNPRKKQEMIRGILKLGGIETGLQYVALGLDKDSTTGKEISAAVSTLGNKDYKKLEKLILSNLDAKVEPNKDGTLSFTVIKNKQSVASFTIKREINNSRVTLPSFEGPDGKDISLIKKYAKGYEDS